MTGKHHANFYYRVMPRLVDGIATPFRLDKHAMRVEETHVHEALVNTLVHADHRASQSIRIIKQADAFIFENPGLLRVPRDQLLQGRSDPRNANLLKMFQLLGLGERAGSGFQKIMRAWREQHWLDTGVGRHATRKHTGMAASGEHDPGRCGA